MHLIEFTEKPATTHKAIAVSFDLGGYSDFCNQPDAAVAAPRLVQNIFAVLNGMFAEPKNFGSLETYEDGRLVVPTFQKFTGDGALLIWTHDMGQDFPPSFCTFLVQRMRAFQQHLIKMLPIWEKEWRVNKLPRTLRVGIAHGVVYAVRPPHAFTSWTEPVDYMGYCINLAVRFQSHYRELGFVIHRGLHPEIQNLEALVAVKIKGAQDEPVFAFAEDVQRVRDSVDFKRRFRANDA